MSGSKYTTVDSSELANLRRDASQLRALRQDLPERIENAVRQTQQNIEARLAPIEARQREFSRAIQGLNSDIRQVEQAMAQRIAEHAQKTRKALQETAAKMEQQRRELRQELRDTAQSLREENQESEERLKKQIQNTEKRLLQVNEETRQQMREQEQRLSQAIANERQERERGLQAANERINAIHKDRERLAGIAREQLQAAQALHDFIAGHYQHEHFAPNQLNRLERAIFSAQKSLNQGAAEAALAEANTAYQNLSDLRLELERLEDEWRIWRVQALQEAGRILAEAQANRKLSDIEGTGEISEVNYWTNGKLAGLEAEINEALSRAENEKKPLTIDEMRKLVEETLPAMDEHLDSIVEEARLAVLSSQIRTNIADLAMQALESQGYTPLGGVYEGEDMRSSFVSKAKNRAGSEVVISVIPEGDKNKVTIDSFEPSPRAPGELLQRSREIASSMRQQGLTVADPTTASETPSAVNRDLETVRKRKTKPSTK